MKFFEDWRFENLNVYRKAKFFDKFHQSAIITEVSLFRPKLAPVHPYFIFQFIDLRIPLLISPE